MKKIRRIMALAGAVLLLALYVVTFVSACLAAPQADTLFRACVAATVFVPVVIYAYTLVYRMVSGRGSSQFTEEEQFPEGTEEKIDGGMAGKGDER